jgi:hypothetical protein
MSAALVTDEQKSTTTSFSDEQSDAATWAYIHESSAAPMDEQTSTSSDEQDAWVFIHDETWHMNATANSDEQTRQDATTAQNGDTGQIGTNAAHHDAFMTTGTARMTDAWAEVASSVSADAVHGV